MAEVQGQTQGVHRLGSKQSGAWGHVRGWNIGVVVEIAHVDGSDVVRVYRTGGSSQPHVREFIGEFTDEKVPV